LGGPEDFPRATHHRYLLSLASEEEGAKKREGEVLREKPNLRKLDEGKGEKACKC